MKLFLGAILIWLTIAAVAVLWIASQPEMVGIPITSIFWGER